VQVDLPRPAPEPPPVAQPPEPLDLPALLDGDHRLVAPLVAAGITTPEALTALTAREVQLRPGIGPKRVLAIAAALQRHGLTFAADGASRAPEATSRPGLRRLTDGWCRAVLDRTGRAYRWTPSGPDSDQRAAAALYDAVGWDEDPDDAIRADVRGTVDRYLGHCRETGRIPTLPDLVRQLARWRQEPGVRERPSPSAPRPSAAEARADKRRSAIAALDRALLNLESEESWRHQPAS
jgi:hypothetical protein